MKESFKLRETFKSKPSLLYKAWLDSKMHSDMIGAKANCSNIEGNSFTSLDGYIEGKNIELLENKMIIQSWRTVEFDENDEDSLLSIELIEKEDGNTELILTHTNIPEGQTQYKQGWIDNYFIPMKEYFSE